MAAALVLVAAPAFAFDFRGEKKLLLHMRDGKDIEIDTVDFMPQGDGSATYKPAVDTSKMKTFFLSMRDFKCEEGSEIEEIKALWLHRTRKASRMPGLASPHLLAGVTGPVSPAAPSALKDRV